MSSIDNSYQSDLHYNNINQTKLDEIYKYIKKFDIYNMNQENLDEICNYINNRIKIIPNSLKLLNMIELDSFVDDRNINNILREINFLTVKSKRSTTIFREKNILEFLRLYYDSYKGTLIDKLLLFEYCLSKDIFKNYIYDFGRYDSTSNRILIQNILNNYVNRGRNNVSITDLSILVANCESKILYKRYIAILERDISILKTMIEKQKNDKIELKYKLYYEYFITEKGICKMIVDYAFPSLDKTIMLEQITSYKVLLED